VVRWLFPFTAVLSVALPWWFLLGDPFHRPAPALVAVEAGRNVPTALARIIAPHLFLVHAQLLVETFSFFMSVRITAYVRISLPIAYVSYRLPVIFQWWKDAAAYLPSESLADDGKMLRLLAIGNGIFWAFGLFGFLLPYVLSYFFVEPDVNTYVSECQSSPGSVRLDEATTRNLSEVGSLAGRSESASSSTATLRSHRRAPPISWDSAFISLTKLSIVMFQTLFQLNALWEVAFLYYASICTCNLWNFVRHGDFEQHALERWYIG
jgi:hypothetical protein